MSRSNKSLAILLVTVLGLWGCSRSASTNGNTTADRLRILEQKCAKLEDDCRNLLAVRDQMRKHITNLEAENVRMTAELDKKKVIQQERDNFRQLAEARSQERDQLQVRNEKLRKGIQSLLGQDESAAATNSQPVPVSGIARITDGKQS